MTGARLDFNLRDLKSLDKRFSEFADAADDGTPLMTEIASYLEFSTQRRFETETDPDGERWAATQRGGAILQDTGGLLASLTSEAGRDTARVGTNKIYAGIHQFGGMTGRNRAVEMPARAFLGVNGEDEDAIGEIVADYYADHLRDALSGSRA